MENFNKNLPLITAIIGFGILIFSIFSSMAGIRTELKNDVKEIRTEIKAVRTELKAEIQNVKTELTARMDSIESKLDQLILLQAQRMLPPKPIKILPKKSKKIKRKPAQSHHP